MRAGFCRIARTEFGEKWSGYSALFDYTDAFENAPKAQPTFMRLAPFVRKFRGVLLQVLLLATIVTFLHLLFPIFTQIVVDKVIVENSVGLLQTILIAMSAALLFTQAANLAQQYLLAAVRIDAAILDFLTRQLLALPMSYFHSRRTATSSAGSMAGGRCACSPCNLASAACSRSSRSRARSLS